MFNRKIVAGLILVLLGLLMATTALAKPTAAAWAGQVVRLHVLANSDSAADQALKLQVRDAILARMPELFAGAQSQAEALQIVGGHLSEVEAIASQVVKDSGYDYPVHASVGRFDFPDRQYGEVELPAGTYEALRLEIGAAEGANWWCVLFPPLCFNDWTHGIVREAKPGTGGRETVTKGRPQLRSKLLDWLTR
jgi:stage II sporulation protein R